MRYAETIHPRLAPMHLVSRAGRHYHGPCPFCADGGTDRFQVWLEASGGRPAGRYWCRVCNRSGLLSHLDAAPARPGAAPPPPPARPRPPAEPDPAHAPLYRQLYAAVARWGRRWLDEPSHPEPRAYLRRRHLREPALRRIGLGVTLHDPLSLPAYLRTVCPEALPYAEAAGVLVADPQAPPGSPAPLRAHWNLTGRLLFPYVAGGEVVDLRTRRYDGGKGYRSLGPYEARGALTPFAWDEVAPGTRTVIVAEAEIKALAALQEYFDGRLSAPTIGQPGLALFRAAWAAQLRARGVAEVVLCYDSRPGPAEGPPRLSPEELWSLRHGLTCQAAGLQVRVARLPVASDQAPGEIDTFIPSQGADRFQALIDAAPPLADYHRSLSRALLAQHHLPPPDRPRPIALPPIRPLPLARGGPAEPPPAHGAPARSDPAHHAAQELLAATVAAHAEGGQGFLIMPAMAEDVIHRAAHIGLSRRVAQGQDVTLAWASSKGSPPSLPEHALPLLQRRTPSSCRMLAEAGALARRGYRVHQALCAHRCPFAAGCAYLGQFQRTGSRSADAALLPATGWWREADLLVLEQLEPAALFREVQLGQGDLRASPAALSHIKALPRIMGWLRQTLQSSADRALSGTPLLDALDRHAAGELAAALGAAVAAIPAADRLSRLEGLPAQASPADYLALPSGHLADLIRLLDAELRAARAGRPIAGRVEARDGALFLLLRDERLLAQLARPDQPKLILDPAASPALLQALFPHTPIRQAAPAADGHSPVIQVIGADWDAPTLQRDTPQGRRRLGAWFAAVASRRRPGRPALVCCDRQWAPDLRLGLAPHSQGQLAVTSYDELWRGAAPPGADLILAQPPDPALAPIRRAGRALFAGVGPALDERLIVESRTLRDPAGNRWEVPAPTFADPRLAALLAARREATMLRCALRWRGRAPAGAQITVLSSLPIPGLPPVTIEPAGASEGPVRVRG